MEGNRISHLPSWGRSNSKDWSDQETSARKCEIQPSSTFHARVTQNYFPEVCVVSGIVFNDKKQIIQKRPVRQWLDLHDGANPRHFDHSWECHTDTHDTSISVIEYLQISITISSSIRDWVVSVLHAKFIANIEDNMCSFVWSLSDFSTSRYSRTRDASRVELPSARRLQYETDERIPHFVSSLLWKSSVKKKSWESVSRSSIELIRFPKSDPNEETKKVICKIRSLNSLSPINRSRNVIRISVKSVDDSIRFTRSITGDTKLIRSAIEISDARWTPWMHLSRRQHYQDRNP